MKSTKKYFASHPLSQYWSSRNTIKPENVTLKSHKIIWFNCNVCNHEFDSAVSNITKGQWCPYCSVPCRRLCDDEDCKVCFNNSFASHKMVHYWSSNNSISPREVKKCSHTKYNFTCSCGHEFQSQLQNIVKGRWCPYCSNPCKKLCTDINCMLCLNNSFESVITNNLQCHFIKRNFIKNSMQKQLFKCLTCKYTFKAALYSIANGSSCPVCINKTEKKLLEWLKDNFEVKFQVKYDWCKNIHTNKHLPFDFEILDNIIIELDGKQHFEQVSNWRNPDEQFKIDIYKMKCAINNNMHIIRVLQEDIWYDKYNWKYKLMEIIENLKINDTPCIELIDNDCCYYIDNKYTNIL
jgi:hypothetical protein